MPGLDLSQVSSNWKKLQEKLQIEKKQEPQKNGLKRKRLEDRRPERGLKRTKFADSRPKRSRINHQMGQNGSRNEDPKAPDDAHTKLAKQHDIPQKDISAAYGVTNGPRREHVDDINGGLHPTHKLGKYVAMDCEMVGTGPPPHYEDNVLARVSLVNFHGEQIYDSYVLPPPTVTVEDYRTFVSGITSDHLVPGYARPLPQVQEDVARLLDGHILVGHALQNDLQVLLLSHPKRHLRDTSRHPKFRLANRGRPPALRKLAKSELGWDIQAGEHSSIEDARAAMMLFSKEKAGFEEENRKRFGVGGKTGPMLGKASGAAGKEDDVGEADGCDSEDDAQLLDGEEADRSDDDADALAKQPAQATAKKKRKRKKNTKRK